MHPPQELWIRVGRRSRTGFRQLVVASSSRSRPRNTCGGIPQLLDDHRLLYQQHRRRPRPQTVPSLAASEGTSHITTTKAWRSLTRPLPLRPGTAVLVLTTAPPNSCDSPRCGKRPYLGQPTASPNTPDPPPRACGRASFVQPVHDVRWHEGRCISEGLKGVSRSELLTITVSGKKHRKTHFALHSAVRSTVKAAGAVLLTDRFEVAHVQ